MNKEDYNRPIFIINIPYCLFSYLMLPRLCVWYLLQGRGIFDIRLNCLTIRNNTHT